LFGYLANYVAIHSRYDLEGKDVKSGELEFGRDDKLKPTGWVETG
jgi:hypothetical protein